jgi:hypothetical protein
MTVPCMVGYCDREATRFYKVHVAGSWVLRAYCEHCDVPQMAGFKYTPITLFEYREAQVQEVMEN